MTSHPKTEQFLRVLRTIIVRSIYFLPSLILALTRVRLVSLTHPERIGHLAGEMDCLLKERALNRLPRYKPILVAPQKRIASAPLLDYWAEHISVIRSDWWCAVIAPLYRFRYLRYKRDISTYLVAINSTAEVASIQRVWGDRPPLLKIRDSDASKGEMALRELGIPDGAEFVCFHSREGGYWRQDDHVHSFRNSPIRSYIPAMEALAKRGIWSIRMGDPTMEPLPSLPSVIDYAHSKARTDWLDLFLCGRGKFFVGNTSGIFLVAAAFGTPCCLTNISPFSAATAYGAPRDRGIPKLLWSEKEKRLLTFREILSSPIANFRFAGLYDEYGFRLVDNTAEELRDVALEMLDLMQSRVQYSAEDEDLQRRFKSLLRPGHHAYGGASRIGRDFLRKYAHLLGD